MVDVPGSENFSQPRIGTNSFAQTQTRRTDEEAFRDIQSAPYVTGSCPLTPSSSHRPKQRGARRGTWRRKGGRTRRTEDDTETLQVGRAWMAEAKALTVNVSVPSNGLQGRSRLEKLMLKWLDVSDEAERRLKYVLWGPGGVGKSTLALKFAAGQAEPGGERLWLVFRLSASSESSKYPDEASKLVAPQSGQCCTN